MSFQEEYGDEVLSDEEDVENSEKIDPNEPRSPDEDPDSDDEDFIVSDGEEISAEDSDDDLSEDEPSPKRQKKGELSPSEIAAKVALEVSRLKEEKEKFSKVAICFFLGETIWNDVETLNSGGSVESTPELFKALSFYSKLMSS